MSEEDLEKGLPEVEEVTFNWIPSTDPRGFFEIYSNYLHVTWTKFDLRLLFGLLRPRLGEEGKFIIEEKGAVTLSIYQVKNLHSMLGGWLESYEKTNGELQPLELTPRPGNY